MSPSTTVKISTGVPANRFDIVCLCVYSIASVSPKSFDSKFDTATLRLMRPVCKTGTRNSHDQHRFNQNRMGIGCRVHYQQIGL